MRNPRRVQVGPAVWDVQGDNSYSRVNQYRGKPEYVPPTNMMRWNREWVEGYEYTPSDVVRIGGWTMVCIRPTTEFPAPVRVGSPFYLYDGTIGSRQETNTQWTFGNRYTFGVSGYLTGWRIDTVAGNAYRVFSVINGVVREALTFEATGSGWQEFNLDAAIIMAGTVLDVVAVVSEPDPTPTTWTGNWNYATPNNEGVPVSGQVSHADKAKDSLRFHKIEDDGGNSGADLLALSVGDLINGPGISWSVQNVADMGDWVDITVAPQTQGTPDGLSAFEFETVTATPITVPVDAGYWGTSPYAAQGFEGQTYSTSVFTDDAFGIDLEVQNATVPVDWDVLAYSGDFDTSTPAVAVASTQSGPPWGPGGNPGGK